MHLYVPDSVNIDSVNCVNVSDLDLVYFSYSNGSAYKLSYNNLTRDYTVDSLSSLDVACHDVILTHDVFYRKDLSDILVIFIILSIVCFYFPYRIISRLFGRWLKI